MTGETLPADWIEALDRLAAAKAGRIAVIGPTDAGKSHFIELLLAQRPELGLLDLDPGQKMVGPPGTASYGAGGDLRRFTFLGSTSAAELGRIVRAADALAGEAEEAFVVNTSGFVRGLGARVQIATLAAVKPDFVVALGADAGLEQILEAQRGPVVLRLARSGAATRKSPARRARIRQAALDMALEGCEPLVLRREAVRIEPAPPASLEEPARPLCALSDADGNDMALAVLESASDEELMLVAPPLPRPAKLLRLGKMWVERKPAGWALLDRLRPAWAEG